MAATRIGLRVWYALAAFCCPARAFRLTESTHGASPGEEPRCLSDHPLPIAKGILGDRGLRVDLHSEPISSSVIDQWGLQTSLPLKVPSTTQFPASFFAAPWSRLFTSEHPPPAQWAWGAVGIMYLYSPQSGMWMGLPLPAPPTSQHYHLLFSLL